MRDSRVTMVLSLDNFTIISMWTHSMFCKLLWRLGEDINKFHKFETFSVEFYILRSRPESPNFSARGPHQLSNSSRRGGG